MCTNTVADIGHQAIAQGCLFSTTCFDCQRPSVVTQWLAAEKLTTCFDCQRPSVVTQWLAAEKLTTCFDYHRPSVVTQWLAAEKLSVSQAAQMAL